MENQQKSSLIAKHQTQVILSEWERKILEIMKYLFFALPFFALLNFQSFFYSSIFTKLMFFYFVVELLCLLYIFLLLQNSNYLPNFFSKIKGVRKKNWILIATTGYISIVAFTNLFSVNPYKSFFGSIAWENGFLTLVHFFLLFVVLSSVFKKDAEWLTFFRLNSLVAIWICLSVLFQKIANNVVAPDGGFGNPAYLNGYLIFAIFGAMALFFWEASGGWRKIHIAIAALGLLIMFYATDIRGGKFGAIAGIFVFCFLFFLANKSKLVKRISALLVAIGFVFAGIFFFYVVSSGKVYAMFERSNTVRTRLIAWEEGIKGFSDKPLTGYGLENYITVFEKYFNPAYNNNGTGEFNNEFGMDMPHNKLVEVLVSNGIFAFLAYLTIFVSIFWAICQKYQEALEEKYLALAGLFVAYFVYLFFLFDTVSTFAMFFMFLAYLNSQTSSYLAVAPVKIKQGGQIVFVLVTAILVFLIAVYFFVFKPSLASFDCGQALTKGKRSDFKGTLESFERLRNDRVYWVENSAVFHYLRGPLVDQLSILNNQENAMEKLTEDEKDYFRKMSTLGEDNLEKNPTLDYYAITLGIINNIIGNFDETYWQKNIPLLEKLIRQDSKRYDSYAALAESYGRVGQKEKIKALEERAISLDPKYAYPYFVFGGIYLKFDEFEKASAFFEKAIEKGCRSVICYQGVVDANLKMTNFPKAIIAGEKIVVIKNDDPQLQANLMLMYFNNKEYEKARRLAKDIEEKFPAAKKQLAEFLKLLPN